jgi:phosphatidylglycerophosphatase A
MVGCWGRLSLKDGFTAMVEPVKKRRGRLRAVLKEDEKCGGDGRNGFSGCQEGSVQRTVARHLVVLFSTGLYTGYSPIAPGTLGTIVAVPLYLILSRLSAFSYGVTMVTFLFMATWIAWIAEAIFLKRDSQRIVIDEIGGFLVTMAFLPATPRYVFFGFLLFRFFDIVKPFPTRKLETLKGGYGVVADDLMAGIYSNVVLRICMSL